MLILLLNNSFGLNNSSFLISWMSLVNDGSISFMSMQSIMDDILPLIAVWKFLLVSKNSGDLLGNGGYGSWIMVRYCVWLYWISSLEVFAHVSLLLLKLILLLLIFFDPGVNDDMILVGLMSMFPIKNINHS